MDSKNKILITTLGTGKDTEASIKKVCDEYNCKMVYIFYTAESEKQNVLQRTQDLLKSDCIEFEGRKIKDENDPTDIFNECRELIKELYRKGLNPDDIYINYTPGTKAMAAGIFLSGISCGCRRLIYVGGTEKDKTSGRVISGFERVLPSSTTHIFLDGQIKNIKEFFNLYEFLAVKKSFEKIEKNMGINIENNEIFSFLRSVTDIYYSWDKGQYKEAGDKISKLKITDNIKKEISADAENCINNNKEILGLINNKEKGDFFLIIDKIASALRYKEKGYFYITIENIYSTLEFIADYILKKEYNIDKSDVKIEYLKDKIGNWQKYEDYRNNKNKKIQLPLYSAYMLLSDLKNETGQKFMNDKEISNRLQIRNNIVHGNKTIDEKEVDLFYNAARPYFEEFVKKYSVIKEKDLDEILKKFRFPKL